MSDDLYIVRRKVLYRELQPIWDKLTSINYAIVKGEALSCQIYGETWKRRSSDIDILIDKKNIKLLENALHELGFKQQIPKDVIQARKDRVLCLAYSHQIPAYYKNKFGFSLNVDVNYDIFWGEYEGKRCPMDEFLNDTVDINICSSLVKVLSIEKAFVQLVLHHYKEMNSLYHLSYHNCIRTCKFKDVYDMLCLKRDVLTLEKVKMLCEQYEITEFMYYMLYYTGQVFGYEIINDYLSILYNDCVQEIVDCYGLCKSERKNWNVPFSVRLDNDNIWEDIECYMRKEDYDKIKRNRDIFG